MKHDAIRVTAVLETSFWVLAYRAEIAANCLDLFDIVVPDAVEEEILARQAGAAAREYPYATLFRHLKDEMRSPSAEVTPLSMFGAGEAAAIALADELKAVLLINERPGLQYAQNLGVEVASVPAVIVLLRSQGVIGDRAARRKLALVAPNAATTIIDEAARALDALRTV